MSGTVQEDRLPVQQLAILSICRFAEPVALTSVNPYLPEMIESFGVDTNEVAKWAGITSASFSISQCCTSMLWVSASERFGRKPVILISLCCTMATVLLFGFSTSLTWAIVGRTLQGAANGNVGIIRTSVAEMVPQKSLQPRAFSVMPLVWSVGSIFGPMLGGALASPATKYPQLFGDNEFLKRFPFALPNLVASTLFVSGVLTGLLFLKETMAARKNDRDVGLLVGKTLTGLFRKRRDRKGSWTRDVGQASPLLRTTKSNVSPPRVTYREVFSYQSVINLIVYTLLSLHSVASDQLIPVFLHLPHEPTDTSAFSEGIPIKFMNGFGLDSGHIGRIYMIYGIFTMLVQFMVFPRVARRYGILPCLRACTFVFPLAYAATPWTVLFKTDSSRQIALFCVMAVRGCANVFAYPCNTILMTNSASSIPALNTLNGFAVSLSAMGKALGPWIAGTAFTMGVDTGWMVLPWWVLAGFAFAGHLSTWWLVEGEGFASQAIKASSDDEEEEENTLPSDKAAAEANEEFGLLAEDDIDTGRTAQVANGLHKSPQSPPIPVLVQLAGDDPELALEMDDLDPLEKPTGRLLEREKDRERPRFRRMSSNSIKASGLAAPGMITRLRSPMGRKDSDP